MALSAAEETLNNAVNTLMAAWETYIETLSVGDPVYIIPCEPRYGRGATAGTDLVEGMGYDSVASNNAAVAGKVIFDPRRAQRIDITDVTDQAPIPLKVRRWPMFFKVTNGVGDTET